MDRDDDKGDKPVLAPVRDEPPVVARLIVEIRSDGSHTIARGMLQDAAAGEQVTVQAEGTTPLSLAFSLTRALFKLPPFNQLARRLLSRKPR